jgi:hypothetical protein
MSAGIILTQLSVALNHVTLITPKLVSNIRPSRDQLNHFQVLCAQFKEASANLETNLQLLLRKGAPGDKDLRLLADLKSSKDIGYNLSLTTLRKNLILIFQGLDESVLDTSCVRIRKNKTRTRCEKLRGQTPHATLMWAVAFLLSAWNSTGAMMDNTFDFLVEELQIERWN